MSPENLSFPVLCIWKGNLVTESGPASLTTSTAAALRGGYYEGMKIVDAEGREFKVESAKKLHGIGFFFGFNIFLNQRIRIAMDLSLTGHLWTPDEIRKLVLKDFKNWLGWESRDDFDALKRTVETASTTREILSTVSTPARRED